VTLFTAPDPPLFVSGFQDANIKISFFCLIAYFMCIYISLESSVAGPDSMNQGFDEQKLKKKNIQLKIVLSFFF
jgi:hypothetical protein